MLKPFVRSQKNCLTFTWLVGLTTMGPVPGTVQLYSGILIQKPVALSRQFSSTEEEEATMDTIMSSSCVVGDVQWQVEQEVWEDCLYYTEIFHLYLWTIF